MSLENLRTHVRGERARPGIVGAQADVPARGTNRGELIAMMMGKPKYGLCDEGSYFVATNPTPGTAIAGVSGTGAFADAESLLYVRNARTAAEDIRLYLDYLRVQVAVAGTNGTDHRYVMKTEPSGTERWTSGGSLIVPVNPNRNSSGSSPAVIRFGALVTTAVGSDVRLVSNGVIRSVIAVVGDQYVFDFGGEVAVPNGQPNGGLLVANVVVPVPPIILGPGETLVMSLHAAAQTVASQYEFELGYWER